MKDQPELFKTSRGFHGDLRFDGPAYEKDQDQKRLSGQIEGIYNLMIDGKWRTLNEIHDATGYPESSISAQLRHLRKPRFGSHDIQKQPRGERTMGLWEYRLNENG